MTLLRNNLLWSLLVVLVLAVLSASVAQAQPRTEPEPVRDPTSMSANANLEYDDPEDRMEISNPSIDLAELMARIEYPEEARIRNIQGLVVVRVLVDSDGDPLEAVIDYSDHEILAEAAEEAIMDSAFTPARQNGTPIAVWVAVPVTFRLQPAAR